jgi:hypothetical protein
MQIPVDAIREVIRISDRDHPAWDAVKLWLTTQPIPLTGDNIMAVLQRTDPPPSK